MLFFIAMSFSAAAARLRLLKFETFKFFRNGGKNMGFEQGAYGARIKQLRIGKGLTQEQLAERVRVTRTYIAKIENGSQVGPLELAIELADLFEVSLNYLLLGVEWEARDRKQRLQSVIVFLSELEAEL